MSLYGFVLFENGRNRNVFLYWLQIKKIEQITFSNYLASPLEPLSLEEMEDIHEQVLSNADTKNEDFKEFWEEIIRSVIAYSSIRAKWNLMTKNEKMDKDNS